jgi:energy-coupling factor transporter ATP-binding protein EcfA2
MRLARIAICGPKGCGKSPLLRTIAGENDAVGNSYTRLAQWNLLKRKLLIISIICLLALFLHVGNFHLKLPKMKISRIFTALLLSTVTYIANAVPMATMTFDVDFMGMAHLPSGNVLLTGPQKSQATLSFPIQTLYFGTSESIYSKDLVVPLSWAGTEKLVSISSSIDQYFMTDLMGNYMHQGLNELGLTSTFTAGPSLNYANLLKRQSAGSDATRHYNMLDTSSEWISYDLSGDPNALFQSMIRLTGVGDIEDGGLDPFSATDIPQMLLDIAHSTRGYMLQYTIFVDRYKDIKTHEGQERPVEITYGGSAHLTGFSIDGQDLLQAEVPEPPSIALSALGFLACLGVSLRKRARRV